jgi:hypothetical protein
MGLWDTVKGAVGIGKKKEPAPKIGTSYWEYDDPKPRQRSVREEQDELYNADAIAAEQRKLSTDQRDELLAGIRAIGGGGGGGGGGGRGPRYGEAGYQYTPVEIGTLKDRFYDMTLKQTGMTPDQFGVGFEWFMPKWEGGWSMADYERYYRSTEVFKNAYQGIAPEMSVEEYADDSATLNALSLKARGGKLATREELAEYIETGKVPFL